MASDTSLVFNLIARDRLTPQLRTAGQHTNHLRDAFKALGTLAIGGGIVSFLKTSIEEGRESNRISAITAAHLKSTGNAAHVTAAQVGDLATAISNKTGVDDEAIQSGQNLLLTFTNIRNEAGKGNDIFNQASSAVTDLAAAMNNGQVTSAGLKSSSIQLGKALNDPVKGITALTRVGVSFTAQQKEQIATMVKNGDTVGAQKIILKELNGEFGGTAAASTTASEKMKVMFGNLQEAIGKKLIPVIDSFSQKLMGVMNFVSANSSWLVPLVEGLAAVAGVVYVIVKATKAWTAVQAALDVVMDANPIGLIVIGIVLLIGVIVLIATKTRWFQNIWHAVWGAIKSVAVGAWHLIKSAALGVYNWFGSKIAWLKNTFLRGWSVIRSGATSAFNHVKSAFGSAYNWVHGKVNTLVSVFRGLPSRIGHAVSGMFNGIKNAFKSAINFVIRGWNSLHFGIPKINTHIPGIGTIGGGSFGVPHIPYLAKGGIATAAGVAMVGERGPEMISMPKGAAVTPLSRAGGAAGGGDIHVTIEMDGQKVAKVIIDPLKKEIRNRGGNVQKVIGSH